VLAGADDADCEDWLDCCPEISSPRADAVSKAHTAIAQIAGKK